MNISGVDIAMINHSIDQLRDDTSHDITQIKDELKELRKDKNWDADKIHERITTIDNYTTKDISSVKLSIAELVQENKQLREHILNLNISLQELAKIVNQRFDNIR